MENAKSEFYFSSFNKLLKAYVCFAQSELKQYNLSPNEIEVLSFIKEKSCGSEVAREFNVSKTLVSRSVSYLEKKKLLVSEPSTQDKREKILTLTDEGKKISREINEMKEKFFAKTFKHFEEREMLVLEALLKLLLKNIFD
ncbi:MAG: winged helix DNA-binding protein [Clostridia bacterium]|nr:winged helix DNA-binding protein [Clostridia bacterium]